jgi:hypothetical protein
MTKHSIEWVKDPGDMLRFADLDTNPFRIHVSDT